MYHMIPGWEAYYEELEAEERKELFAQLIQELPDDGLHAFRKKLFENRYPAPGKWQSIADRFLLAFVCFPGFYANRTAMFSNVEKEIRKTVKDMGLNEAEQMSEEEKNLLYLELHNAADLYFFTCKDGSYGKKLFGMVQGTDEDRRKQVCEEAWILSKGIQEMTEPMEGLRIFSDAVLDAYFQFDKKAEKMFREYEELQKLRKTAKKKGWFRK